MVGQVEQKTEYQENIKKKGTAQAAWVNPKAEAKNTMETKGEDNPVPIAKRTNRPGTKNNDMFKWEDVSYDKMEGPLGVEEYLQQLIRTLRKHMLRLIYTSPGKDPSDIDKIIALPANVNKSVWMYEHLRYTTSQNF